MHTEIFCFHDNLKLRTSNLKHKLKDYHTILELHPSATGDEIKKAYRRLAHQYHPDKKTMILMLQHSFQLLKKHMKRP